jgi:D-3-phosphoglycerate dehydrogenase
MENVKMFNSISIPSILYKVVISGHGYKNLDIESNELVKARAVVIDAGDATGTPLLKLIKDADALIVGYTSIDLNTIDAMEKCKVIVEYGIGVDNIDLEAACKRKIFVANVPGYGTGEVADQAFALLMVLVRKICILDSLVKTKGWSYARDNSRPMFRLWDKVLGIIGFGRIGEAFAYRAKAFGFKILVYDPYKNQQNIKEKGFIPSNLERIIRESDFISLHTPLTKETENLFGEREFKDMKPNAFLINVARGAIVNEEALFKALKEKWIGGAALDILTIYPPSGNEPLLKYHRENDNLIIVPHTAWYSEESERELRTRAAEEVVRVLSGREPKFWVNKFFN